MTRKENAMEQRSEQFKSNKSVFIVWTIEVVLLMGGFFFEVVKHNHDMRWYLRFLLVMAITFMPGMVEFLRSKGESKIFKYLIAVGYPLFCVYCQYYATTSIAALYLYPVFVLLILYLDEKVLLIASGLDLIGGIVVLILKFNSDGTDTAKIITEYEVIFACLILATAAIIVGIRVIRGNNQNKLDIVERLSNEAEEKSREILSASEAAEKRMQDIECAAGDNANSMKSMAQTINDIGNAIANISNNVQDEANAMSVANKKMGVIKDNTEELAKTILLVQESNDTNSRKLSLINAQAGELLEKSAVTKKNVDEVRELATKVAEVIGVIRQISGQTNLLALNASIEAARAGEAGRGFAVVAEEIRALADSTNKSVVEIENSITMLNESCDIASSSMDESVVSINTQTDSITEIDAAIREEATAMKHISDAISSINSEIMAMATANDNITEQTNNISAVTQEITSSAESAATMSNDVKKMSENILEDIKATNIELEKIKHI